MIREHADNVNRAIKEKVLRDISDIFPIKGNRHEIVLENIRIDESREPDVMDFDTLTKAKNDNSTVATPVKVSLILKDLSGKQVDRGEFTLVKIPLMTATGAFIVGGTDYYVPTQLRLKAGVYHRQKPDNTFESRFNLERGLNFRLVYDPISYRMRIVMSGKTLDFINFLRGVGVSDNEMAAVFGSELFTKIADAATGTPEKELEKFFSIVHYGSDEGVDKRKWTIDYLNGTAMDSEVNRLTLGVPADTVTPDALLRSAKKLTELAGGRGEEDLTSSLIYKKAFSPDDLLSEAYNKQMRLVKKTLQNRVDKYDKLTQIIPVSYMQKPIDQFFSKSSLAQAIETENPTSMINQLYKVTLTGEGGFGDDRAISNLDRSLDPYYLGFLDPVHTPESDKIGVNLFRSLGSKLKPGTKELWTVMWNVKTGRDEEVTPIGIYEKRVAFPNEGKLEGGKIRWYGDKVKVLYRGKIVEVPPEQVDYFIKKPTEIFDPTTNLVPFLDSAQGARAMMASKHMSHAIALKDPEIPLVMTEDPNEQPYEYTVGNEIAITSPVDGTVSKVTPKKITIIDKDNKKVNVSLANNFHTSANFFLNHTPRVKEGDRVKKGDLLADSNYTRDGALALGTNLDTAYMNYKGFNFEDGIVISETASKKLTSEHMYVIDKPVNDNTFLGKDKFRAYYPTKYTAAQLEKVGDDGIVKKGVKLKPGDPIILALTRRSRTMNEELLGDLSKQVLRDMKASDEVWDGAVEGEVTEVVVRPSYVKVYIKTAEPVVVGDKITGRHGNKGTIGAIIPDSEMPHTEDGRRIDVILNPHGITSRINPSQLLEMAASKIAEVLGEPVQVAAFELTDSENPDSRVEWIKGLTDRFGIKDKEKIIDPKEGPIEAPTLVGKEYFIKLPQQISKKTSIREERGYDIDYQPLRGSSEYGASRAIDPLTAYSLMSHDARANLKEMATYKAERNDDFWDAIQNGRIPPAPKPTFAFEKFLSYLKAAGINTEKNNGSILVRPMKDKEVLKQSNGEVYNASMLSGYNFEPEKGGLFDPQVMGGLEGSKWGHITLSEPVPNPTFDDEIRIILDITKPKYDALVKGITGVDEHGNFITPPAEGNYIRGEAFKKLLSMLDTDAVIAELEEKAKTENNPDTLNKILRRLRYLKGLKKTGTKPEDLVIQNVPVIPSKMRPVYAVEGEDQVRMADINLLYRDAILMNNSLKELKGRLPEDELGEVYAGLYDALKALSGNGAPISKDALQAGAGGVLEFVGSSVGSSPKSGYFQGKTLKRRQELSGTGVIQNAPDMDMDEAGVPEKMAFSVYKPFVIQKLKGLGYDPKQIREMIESGDPLARKVLEKEMETRPILLNRSPSLHKFNIMAFKPKVVAGDAIKINPQVVKGFNADFDGDAMGIHVPVTEEARKEAYKMLPSANLFKPGTGTPGKLIHGLSMEYISGLYLLTKNVPIKEGDARVYQTYEDMYNAFVNNNVKYSEPAVFNGRKSTLGKHLVNALFPESLQNYDKQWTKKDLNAAFNSMAKEDPDNYVKVSNTLKELGRLAAYRIGIGMGISDLADTGQLKSRLEKELKEVETIKDDDDRARELERLAEELEDLVVEEAPALADSGNAFYQMFISGAKGSPGQVKQILEAPVAVSDTFGKTVPVPIKRGYAEGLSPTEYWSSLYGARYGMIAKKMMVAEPGALNKEILNTLVEKVISATTDEKDPGIPVSLSNRDVEGRVVAEDLYKNGKKLASRGDVIDGTLRKKLLAEDVYSMVVKSPLTSTIAEGLAADNFGLDETGNFPKIGDNVGVKSGQALSEPLSQTSMSLFHTGGASGEDNVNIGNVFESIQTAINMPKTLKNAAVLSRKYGIVEDIKERPGGGWLVTVSGEAHEIPGYLKLKVDKGQTVRVGEPLSSGQIPPRDMLELRGLTDMQNTLVEELKGYLKAMGEDINRSTLETLVSGITQTAEVIDAKDRPGFSAGAIMPVQKITAVGLENKKPVKLDEAIGMKLARNYGRTLVHTKITPEIAAELKEEGHSIVEAYEDVVDWKPVIVGSGRQTTVGNDWLHKMTFRYLRKVLPESAVMGNESNLHGYNPLTAWVYGADISRGTSGQY